MARGSCLVWLEVVSTALESQTEEQPAALAVSDSDRGIQIAMIILLHPKTAKPRNRRFPLPVLAMAAVLEGKEDYVIVDGNVEQEPGNVLDRITGESGAELLAVSVMPGPQMAAAIPICREFRKKYPRVPIVWGGYFASDIKRYHQVSRHAA